MRIPFVSYTKCVSVFTASVWYYDVIGDDFVPDISIFPYQVAYRMRRGVIHHALGLGGGSCPGVRTRGETPALPFWA
jgi:hypothetical protein